jgi:hypothetical protein
MGAFQPYPRHYAQMARFNSTSSQLELRHTSGMLLASHKRPLSPTKILMSNHKSILFPSVPRKPQFPGMAPFQHLFHRHSRCPSHL